MSSVFRIKPNHYIHVLDTNENVSKVIEGPLTFTRKEHEQIIVGPLKMIMVRIPLLLIPFHHLLIPSTIYWFPSTISW